MSTKTHRAGLGQRITRSLLALVMAIGTAVGIGITTAAPAQAEGWYTYYYPVMPVDVCQHQGHFGATTLFFWNPYSLSCYDLSVPAGVTFTGGLDFQGFCEWKYPGSYATVDGKTVMDWKCVRRELRQ